MFSLARALSSPASAEDCSSLFDRLIGTTARSDSSGACRSAVRLFAFSDRSRFWLDREASEISRFSCMSFLSVRGVLNYAEPVNHSRSYAADCIAFPSADGVSALVQCFSKLNTRPTDAAVYASRSALRRSVQNSRSGWIRFLLSCRALSSPTTCRFIPAHPRIAYDHFGHVRFEQVVQPETTIDELMDEAAEDRDDE